MSINGIATCDANSDLCALAIRFLLSPCSAVSFSVMGTTESTCYSMNADLVAESSERVAVQPDIVDPILRGSIDINSTLPSLRHFGGYKSIIADIWVFLLRGLQFNQNQDATALRAEMWKPPRGLLLFGPRGTGKSTLIRKMAAASNASIEEISHSILLSR